MKKILSLLALSCFGIGAWAQTVVARMQDFVNNGTNNGVTEASVWKASEDKVYSFSDNHYFSGITNDAVVTALEGDKYVTVAMYVYGNTLTGCPFGYGDNQNGLKFAFRSNSSTVEVTTKGVADFTTSALGSMQQTGWNLVAFTVPGKTCAGTDTRYISPAGHYTKSGKNLSNMKDPAEGSKKFAIGSGDQGTTRECFSGLLANVTVMTSDGLLSIGDVQAKMGSAPTLNTVESAFPVADTYYAYIENKETSRMPFLYNSIQYSDNVTIQAQMPTEANGFIWKVTSDGNGKVTVKNAENGKGIKATGNCTGIIDEFQYTPGSTAGYYNLINTTLINGGDHDRLNCANNEAYYHNEANLRAVTTWTGNHTDNDWRFDVLNTEGLSEYNVVIAGAENAYVTFDGKKAANGGFFLAASVAKGDLTASNVLGHESNIIVEGNTIKVTYTQTATPVEVTYNIYVGEEKVGEQKVTELDGEQTQFTLNAPDYVNVTGIPATASSSVTSVDVITSYKEGALPFKADGTLYNLALNRNPNLKIYVSGEDIKTLATNNANYVAPTFENQAYYKWSFEGNWYTGFTIKNAGANKYVTFGSVAPNDKTQATLIDTPAAGAYFEFRKNGTKYYFRIQGTTNAAYISNNGGNGTTYLTNWNSEANYNGNGDPGAQFIFTDAENIPDPNSQVDVTYVYTLNSSTKSVTTRQTVGETVAAPAAIPFTTLSYDTNTVVVAPSTTVNVTVTEALPFVKTTDPAAPKWGVIRTHSNENRYAYVGEDGKAKCVTTYLTGENEGYLFYITGNVIDGFQLMSQYGALEPTAGQASLGISGAKWELRTGTAGTTISAEKAFSLYNENVTYLNSRPEGNILYWEDNDQGSTMEFVQDVEVEISAAKYATLYSQYPLAVPSGVKAYTLAVQDDYLQATEVTTIPVGVGVVLQAENADTYTFPVAAATAATSCLTGTYTEIAKPEGALVLGIEDDVVGFYNYTGAKVAANKAYYVAEGGENSNLRITFEDLTSIISVAQQNGGQAIYDLQGRRVVNAHNGLYIINGKKVIK